MAGLPVYRLIWRLVWLPWRARVVYPGVAGDLYVEDEPGTVYYDEDEQVVVIQSTTVHVHGSKRHAPWAGRQSRELAPDGTESGARP